MFITFQELKSMVKIPAPGEKIPSAKQLKIKYVPILEKELGHETEIYAYKNGYALYSVGKSATVFPIASCKAYCYQTVLSSVRITEHSFDAEPWFFRLMLEGEDRLFHNCSAREEKWTVSYQALSADWDKMAHDERILDHCIWCETMELIARRLTAKQRIVFRQFYLEEKSQKQIAKGIGVSVQAVSGMLSRINQKAGQVYQSLYGEMI